MKKIIEPPINSFITRLYCYEGLLITKDEASEQPNESGGTHFLSQADVNYAAKNGNFSGWRLSKRAKMHCRELSHLSNL